MQHTGAVHALRMNMDMYAYAYIKETFSESSEPFRHFKDVPSEHFFIHVLLMIPLVQKY